MKYVYAKAFEDAAADIVNYLLTLKGRNEQLLEKEQETEKSIETA